MAHLPKPGDALDSIGDAAGQPVAGFAKTTLRVKSILISLPTDGIVFALLGFEQAVQLGGEAANPERSLPRAVIPSMLIGAGIGGIGIFSHLLDHGGNDDLGLVGGLLVSAAWSLIVYKLAVARRLPEETVDRYVADVYPPPVE